VAKDVENLFDTVGSTNGLAMANKHAQIDRTFGDKLRW
jgi:hypothetical protein